MSTTTVAPSEGMVTCPVCGEQNRRSNQRCFRCQWLLQGAVIGADPDELQARLDRARADWQAANPADTPPPGPMAVAQRVRRSVLVWNRLLQSVPIALGVVFWIAVVVGLGFVGVTAAKAVIEFATSLDSPSPGMSLVRTAVDYLPSAVIGLFVLLPLMRSFPIIVLILFVTGLTPLTFLFVFLPSAVDDMAFANGQNTHAALHRLMQDGEFSVLINRVGDRPPPATAQGPMPLLLGSDATSQANIHPLQQLLLRNASPLSDRLSLKPPPTSGGAPGFSDIVKRRVFADPPPKSPSLNLAAPPFGTDLSGVMALKPGLVPTPDALRPKQP
jgi:hypothetical protein